MIRYSVFLPVVVCLWLLSDTDQPRSQDPKPSVSEPSAAAADAKPPADGAAASGASEVSKRAMPPGDPMTARQAEAIQEIMRIRKLQGDIFAGTMFGESHEGSDQQFAKILQNVIRSAPPTPPTSPPVPASRVALPTNQATLQFNQFVPQPARCEVAIESRTDLTETLRGTADVLDQQASLLERTSRYTDADRLRRLARTVRREARRWADDSERPATQQARRSRTTTATRDR